MSHWKDKDDFTTAPIVMADDRDVIEQSRQCVLYYTSSQSAIDRPPSIDTHCHPSTAALGSTVGRRGSDASGNNMAIVQTFTIGNSEHDYNDEGWSDDDDDDEEGEDIHDLDDSGDYNEYSGVRSHDADHDLGPFGSATRLNDALVACGSSVAADNVDVELSSSTLSCRHGAGEDRIQSVASSAVDGGSMSTIVFVGGCSRVQQAGSIGDELVEDSIESYLDGGSDRLGRLRRQRSGDSQQHLVGGGSWTSSFGGVRWTGYSSASSFLSCCQKGDESYGSSSGGLFCRRCLTGCVRSRPCLFFVYVIVVLVLISSCVSLILVGVLVTEPYIRVSTFVNSTCVPVAEPPRTHLDDGRYESAGNGNVTGVVPSSPRPSIARSIPDVILQTCSCGKGCNSKYRCLRLHVRYQQPNGLVTSTILYDDETSLNRQVGHWKTLNT